MWGWVHAFHRNLIHNSENYQNILFFTWDIFLDTINSFSNTHVLHTGIFLTWKYLRKICVCRTCVFEKRHFPGVCNIFSHVIFTPTSNIFSQKYVLVHFRSRVKVMTSLMWSYWRLRAKPQKQSTKMSKIYSRNLRHPLANMVQYLLTQGRMVSIHSSSLSSTIYTLKIDFNVCTSLSALCLHWYRLLLVPVLCFQTHTISFSCLNP